MMVPTATLLVVLTISTPPHEAPAQVPDDEIALLIEALEHKDANIRQRAVIALGERGAEAQAAVPKLIEMLAAGDWRAREDTFFLAERRGGPIVLALAEIGPPAAPALVEALSHEDKDVSQGAALALCRVRPVAREAVLPTFTKMLDSEDPVTRQLGAYCLGHVGESAAMAVPVLIKALSDKDNGVRGMAIMAIGRIGRNAPEAVPFLVEMLEKDPGDAEVITALGRMGSTAAPAVPAIVVSLNSEDESDRIRAATALGNIGPAASEAVPDLVKRLDDSSLKVRLVAVNALRSIGPEAKAAVPALKKKLQLLSLIRQSGPERHYIEKALQRIAGDDRVQKD